MNTNPNETHLPLNRIYFNKLNNIKEKNLDIFIKFASYVPLCEMNNCVSLFRTRFGTIAQHLNNKTVYTKDEYRLIIKLVLIQSDFISSDIQNRFRIDSNILNIYFGVLNCFNFLKICKQTREEKINKQEICEILKKDIKIIFDYNPKIKDFYVEFFETFSYYNQSPDQTIDDKSNKRLEDHICEIMEIIFQELKCISIAFPSNDKCETTTTTKNSTSIIITSNTKGTNEETQIKSDLENYLKKILDFILKIIDIKDLSDKIDLEISNFIDPVIQKDEQKENLKKYGDTQKREKETNLKSKLKEFESFIKVQDSESTNIKLDIENISNSINKSRYFSGDFGNRKDLYHAEAMIFEKILKGENYVGISKLCCPLCDRIKFSINKIESYTNFKTRGRHKECRPFYELPTRFKNETNFMKAFFGDIAYDIWDKFNYLDKKISLELISIVCCIDSDNSFICEYCNKQNQ